MESSVRWIIGFILIHQLLQIVDAKVIKQNGEHELAISFMNETLARPQVEASIIDPPTPSNVTLLTHM
jgi:hypothetical protein